MLSNETIELVRAARSLPSLDRMHEWAPRAARAIEATNRDIDSYIEAQAQARADANYCGDCGHRLPGHYPTCAEYFDALRRGHPDPGALAQPGTVGVSSPSGIGAGHGYNGPNRRHRDPR